MNSGPAFPVSTSDGTQGHQDGAGTWQFPGMSIRDYFAAKAMNGFICLYIAEHLQGDLDPQVLAEHAYEVADAMLMAREATPALKPTRPAPFPTPDNGNRPFGYFGDAGGPL